MKNLLVLVLLTVLVSTIAAQDIKVSTETSLRYNESVQAIDFQRIQFNSPYVNLKYDLKKNLNGVKTNDVFSLFSNNLVNSKTFTFDIGMISLLDYQKEDEHFLDVYAKQTYKNISISLELGRGVGKTQRPRDYAISRVSHELFTIEAGFVTKKGYDNLNEFTQDKYYWGSFHPKNIFFAIGNQPNGFWTILGTKGFDNFGSFGFLNYNKETGNFWFRNQVGVKNANQAFFSQNNYVVSTSYLIVTPFHDIHFSPASTKGLWALKLDAKRTGNLEKKELLIARQFGWMGQLGVGFQNALSKGNGITVEYFNSIKIGNSFGTTVEIRYESLFKNTGGYLTTWFTP